MLLPDVQWEMKTFSFNDTKIRIVKPLSMSLFFFIDLLSDTFYFSAIKLNSFHFLLDDG